MKLQLVLGFACGLSLSAIIIGVYGMNDVAPVSSSEQSKLIGGQMVACETPVAVPCSTCMPIPSTGACTSLGGVGGTNPTCSFTACVPFPNPDPNGQNKVCPCIAAYTLANNTIRRPQPCMQAVLHCVEEVTQTGTDITCAYRMACVQMRPVGPWCVGGDCIDDGAVTTITCPDASDAGSTICNPNAGA
jgi:hypothetical protein